MAKFLRLTAKNLQNHPFFQDILVARCMKTGVLTIHFLDALDP